MAFIDKTMFEITVSNTVNNQTQHIAGKFGTFAGDTFTGADCSAGILAVRHSLLPSEGYESIVDGSDKPEILNGNSWYMIAASNGAAGSLYGDHTGIYAFDNYETSRAQVGDNLYFVGGDTLGVGLPANTRGDFGEIIINEQYSFGLGNFTSEPTVGQYATISNGKLAPAANAPAGGSGVYFKVLRKAPVTEGAYYWGDKYVLQALRTAEAA